MRSTRHGVSYSVSCSPVCPLSVLGFVCFSLVSVSLFFVSQGTKANKHETLRQTNVISDGSTNKLQDTLRSCLWTDLDRLAPLSVQGSGVVQKTDGSSVQYRISALLEDTMWIGRFGPWSVSPLKLESSIANV